MPSPLYQVDAFTDAPFAGNPAGVTLLTEPADAPWMLAVAAEMNLAETAFLVRTAPGAYDLRWFSPAVEIDLCGHATLASAHVLWSEEIDDAPELRFQTRSGELRASRLDDGRIELDFPVNPPVEGAVDDGVLDALAVKPVRTAATANGWLLVEVAAAGEVRDASPDLVRLGAVTEHGVILTAAAEAGGEVDIVSRVFAPAFGIPEDPVTGSAHCVLAAWWCHRIGRDQIEAEQASTRGGRMTVVLDGERVRLRGAAVTTVRGELLV
jgi:PhzF family phenazine biosynthesis protein